MKNKPLRIFSVGLTLTLLSCSTVYAKKIFPAEVVGRDLDIPIGKRFGHVGITNAPMFDPSGMSQGAYLVLEVLKETPVGQINTMGDFISRTKFWGSKWGVADQGERGYRLLLEANRQRQWCPKYTSDTRYHIGSGVVDRGIPIECGIWRCDTYVWWAFFSQGWNVMPGSIWLPSELFNYFPYYNFNVIDRQPTKVNINKTLDNITAEELNELSPAEFQQVMDRPLSSYAISSSALQLEFANNPDLNEEKRAVMVDRLTLDGTEKNLVKKLLNLYNNTDNKKLKNTIVQDLMLYNQQHNNVKFYVNNEQPILKVFFDELLDNKSLSPSMIDDGLRGYIDTHSADEIIINLSRIDKWLPTLNNYSSIMLKYSLVLKSKQLQSIYIKSIIDELRKQNNSDLDSYFFGPLSIHCKGLCENLVEPDSMQLIIDYLNEVHYKYTLEGIKENPSDFHRGTTAPYYLELSKIMGL